ncbi:MAG: aminoacyl-tRNA hydrolase [Solirubrobacterales bacterium]
MLATLTIRILTLLAVAAAIFKRSGKPVPVDWLIVGLGNPGRRYAGTRHNIGEIAALKLIEQYDLGKPKSRYRGRFAEGRLEPGGPRVAVLIPETYMNESGKAVGPARGELRVDPEHVVVIHDEIDFPFGRVESKLGGGHGGHNGLKSVKANLGTADFTRVRVGVGRPDSTDPEIVSKWVLGGFDESPAEVSTLVDDALRETLRVLND